MKRRDWDKERKATVMLTIPVTTVFRFFKRRRDEKRRKRIEANRERGQRVIEKTNRTRGGPR